MSAEAPDRAESREPRAVSPEELRAVLGKGGALAKRLPLYEPRPGQLQLAERVADALFRGRALVAEAGTGTGKTLAYLVPAALSGLKVVVSTATKTLQEQLRDKDVPLLAQLGVKARFAFMKGRQNYLCWLRLEEVRRGPPLTAEQLADLGKVEAWAERTLEGDRSELSSIPESSTLWREVSSTADTCTGPKCAHYDRCFVFRMRRQAADADVVVVNHHLFFADLALRSSSAGDAGAAVLPRYDAVIFDEAHAVEDVATEHFGTHISSFRVAELARDALRALSTHPDRELARGLALRLLREGGDYFQALQESAQDQERWPLTAEQLRSAEGERERLTELLRALGAELSRDADEELALLERRCGTLGTDLSLFAPVALPPQTQAQEDPSPGEPGPAEVDGALSAGRSLVPWAELRAGHLFLHASPLEIARVLQSRLYDRIGPVVFASATLAVNGSLSYFSRRVGLADREGPLFPLEEALLPSPFDYQRAAALYLPEGLPDPSAPDFIEAVAGELRKLVALSDGRAFALFTSLRNMRAAHALLAPELSRRYQVLLQGEGPKAQLLRAFRERPSVLFASQSFWEGVDVAGDALRLVAIDKLPFASPKEPLLAARIERLRAQGVEAFSAVQVPQAALALKQGFGRLVRSASDRGVVAVFDPRLSRKGYGKTFLRTLPPARVTRSLDEVADFFAAARLGLATDSGDTAAGSNPPAGPAGAPFPVAR